MDTLIKKLGWTIVLSVGIGILGGSSLSLWEDWLEAKAKPTFEVVPLTQVREEPIKDAVPRKIEIKSLDVNVGVVPGLIDKGEWQVSDTKANYLIGSGVIGSESNMVIYAHKRPKLFGDLSKIKVGEEIVVSGKDVKARYVVSEAFETEIDNLDILNDTHTHTLTLYTCNRWNDSYRYVVRAKMVEEVPTSLIGVINAVNEEE